MKFDFQFWVLVMGIGEHGLNGKTVQGEATLLHSAFDSNRVRENQEMTLAWMLYILGVILLMEAKQGWFLERIKMWKVILYYIQFNKYSIRNYSHTVFWALMMDMPGIGPAFPVLGVMVDMSSSVQVLKFIPKEVYSPWRIIEGQQI